MAKRGRKPKPTRLKVLCGNPGRRRLPENEPMPALGAPAPPEWLDPLAREEWNRIVPRLEAVGLLTQVDGFVLEAYVTCYARWVTAEQTVEKIGTVYQPSSKKGSRYLQSVPHVSIARAYLDEARALAAELGLSPSARTRLAVPEMVDPNDPMELLISGVTRHEDHTEKDR